MTIKHIEKRFKQATCNHSAYKMLPIWGGLFGFCWECTQCGTIKQELEAFKAAFAAGKTSAEDGKKNAKMDELAGTLVDFLKTLKIAVEKEAK